MVEFNKETDYPSRAVAFIDILGFRNKVERIDQNNSLFTEIVSINEIIGRAIADVRRLESAVVDVEGPAPRSLEATAFSDSIVISGVSIWLVVYAAHDLARRLLAANTLTRGGLAHGPLYHKGSAIFGKAMNDAYDIERDLAKVPRIALSPEAAALWKQETAGGILSAYADRVRADSDSVTYIDIFKSGIGEPERRDPVFDERARVVLSGMLEDPTLGYRQWCKVAWLVGCFNRAMNAPISVPPFPGSKV